MENPNTYYHTMHREKYQEMFLQLRDGKINEEDWLSFCNDALELILGENKDILIRLNYR
jgi:hypothetical protein